MKNGQSTMVEMGGKLYYADQLVDEGENAFQRRILEEGYCGFFLPVHFLETKEGITCYHRIDGMYPLKEAISLWVLENRNVAERMCRIVADIATSLLEAEDLLLETSGLQVNPELIFIDPKTHATRLAFKRNSNMKEKISDELKELIRETDLLTKDEEWEAYGQRLCGEIEKENLGLSGIVVHANNMLREMRQRSWPVKESLREESVS